MEAQSTGAGAGTPREASIEPASAIDFAPFRLDVVGGRLLRGEQAIPLRPKTWAVLLYLAERPAALVSKDELLDALWQDVAVTPDTLNKSIGELRVALGDDSKAPRFIETVHRRGFRFLAATRRIIAGRGAEGETRIGSDGMAGPTRRLFVGREEERRRLVAALAAAQSGSRQVVFVTGPPGIGKTALVDDFLSSPAVRESGAPIWVARGGCVDLHGPREAYLPVLEALERLARRPDAERLLALLRRTGPQWLAQMPSLLGEGERQALRQSLQGLGAESMLRELAVLLESLTGELTLILVLEDLHWSDPSTVDLISLLAHRRDPARLLLIGTYRPAEVAVHEHVLAKALRTLQAHRQCVELRLPDLSESAVRCYLAARFPGGAFPEELARLIHAHTSGDPLFVVAIVDHMLARGWIVDTAGGWRLNAPPESIDLGVPDDVRRMIETQFHSLSASERSLLEAASVAAIEMTPPLAAAALDCDIAEAERLCETLARSQRFLRAAGSAESPGGWVARRYVFTHELHRQVVYEEIPAGRRVRLHLRIGETLEAAYGSRRAEISPLLASHFEGGRDPDRALHYLMMAGARARQRFANREAIDYFGAALAFPAKLRPAATRRQRELEVRLALGPALSDAYGFASQQVRENYERAATLCSAATTPAQLLELLYGRWYLHAMHADRDEAAALARELDEVAARIGTAECRVLADSVLVRTAAYEARFAEVMRIAERHPLPGAGRRGAVVTTGPNPTIAIASHAALSLWYLGHPARAQTAAAAALAEARLSGHAFTLAAVLAQAALVELLCRNVEVGGDLARQALALAGEQSFGFWTEMATALDGWARIQDHRAAEGRLVIERALASMDISNARFFATFAYAFLVEGHLREGDREAGLAAAEAGLALAQATLSGPSEPELWRLKGEILLATPAPSRRRGKPTRRRTGAAAAADPHWPEAERCLLRALELSRVAEARSLELRAATSLASAWRSRGRVDEARSMLRDLCRWFEPKSQAPDLVEARALLVELARRS